MRESAAGRVVFVGHSAVLSGAELELLDIAAHTPRAQVLLFEHGPLVEALQRRGVAVQVLGTAGTTLQVRRDSSLLGGLVAAPALLSLLARLLRATRPDDLLYANSQKAWILCALAAAIGRRRAVWHLHDIMTSEHFSPGLAALGTRLANHFACAVIVNSRATGDSVLARGGRPALLRLVHNGIDPAPFDRAGQQDRMALRRSLGLPATGTIVGLFGRLTPWKGQRVLLEALTMLPDMHAVLVGAPLFGEHDYQRELEQLAASPALAGRVHLLGFREDVPEIMHAVDVVAHASTSPEPFGRVIVEALLAGRPVVATRAGGVPEIVEDGREALLVPPGDAGALARALQTLRDDPELALRLAAAGRSRALREFTVAPMMAGLAAVMAEAAPRS